MGHCGKVLRGFPGSRPDGADSGPLPPALLAFLSIPPQPPSLPPERPSAFHRELGISLQQPVAAGNSARQEPASWPAPRWSALALGVAWGSSKAVSTLRLVGSQEHRAWPYNAGGEASFLQAWGRAHCSLSDLRCQGCLCLAFLGLSDLLKPPWFTDLGEMP